MDRSALLERFRTGYDDVEAALAEISTDELDRKPPEGWSARMIVHHLAGSETSAYIRLRQLIAQDDPVIVAYDEEQFAQRLHYDRPIELSLAVVRAVRDASLQLLEAIAPEEWDRAGTHTRVGPYSVDRWLEIYSRHSHDHADQIRRARRGEV